MNFYFQNSKINLSLYSLALIAFVSLFFGSCQSDGSSFAGIKPEAMGRINDIVILADENYSQGAMGDSLLYYFQSSYPVLPAEEPIFDVRFMTPNEVLAGQYKKELRTYVLVADVSDTSSQTTKMLREDLGEEKFARAQKDSDFNLSIGKNKWAKNQIIIYIFGKNHEAIWASLRKNFESIASRINKHDIENLTATVYGIKGENKQLSDLVKNKFGLNIRIPDLFLKAMDTTNLLWLRMDNKIVNQSLVFRKIPYISESQFSVDSIIAMRNAYGKEYIKTGFEDAYMSTNIIDLPALSYQYEHNGIFVKEVRGIWETVNDFMGGPFVSYLLYNKSKGELVFIDAFVYAPGEKKRDLVQQLDCVVKTASF